MKFQVRLPIKGKNKVPGTKGSTLQRLSGSARKTRAEGRRTDVHLLVPGTPCAQSLGAPACGV
eukprot:4561020-Prymnesium_polylepis.1